MSATHYKRCTKCGEVKSLNEFHKDSVSSDGLKSSCKHCRCAATLAYQKTPKGKINHKASNERYGKTEKGRTSQNRRGKRYSQTENGRHSAREVMKRQAELHPKRIFARNAAKHAVRAGRITRQPCEVCGEPDTESHHEDYSKPLDVTWLCNRHHLARHGKRPVENVPTTGATT